MRILLATRSRDKAREIRHLLGGAPGLTLLTLDEIGCGPDPAEDSLEAYETFQENAAAKARHFARVAALPALADDSGLRVDALGGAPGVRTKRFSGRWDLSGRALDEANNEALLERLHGVPAGARGARYVCAAALASPDGRLVVCVGSRRGEIGTSPRGTGGFGYDPLFLIPELGKTFAEIPAAEKNRISHRARAFRGLAAVRSAWPGEG
jgi:XTP/dITP diphosphohydrolase